MIRAILLDVDGTLVNTSGLLIRSLRYALTRHLGGTYPDDLLRDLLGRPLRQQMEHFSAEHAEILAAEFLRYYEEHQSEEEPFVEALQLLRWLSETGFKIALVTSKTAPEMEITGRRFPDLNLAHIRVTSDQTANVKPHPEPALLALQQLHVTADHALMIGDSPYDVQCGHAAGVRTGAALWGPYPRELLEPFHPDHWFYQPEEIRRCLER